MAGYTRTDTSNDIADGKVVNAATFDAEYDAIEAAFNNSTGHTHDGSSAEGAPITVVGPAQEYVADGSDFYPKTDNTYDLGKTGNEWKDLYVNGVAYLDSIEGPLTGNADTATALETARDFSISGGATASAVSFDGTGNIDLDITVTDDGHNHTLSTITDSGTIAAQDADAVNIDGGAVDGTTLGATTPSSAVVTTLNATGALGTDLKSTLIDLLYPVGSIYIETTGTNPNTTFGTGTWAAHAAGRALVGVGDNGEETWTEGQEEGSETHTLTTGELPAHGHLFTGTGTTNTAGAHTHSIERNASGTTGAFGTGFAAFNYDGNNSGPITTSSAGDHSHTVTVTGTTNNEGSGAAHNNLQPSIGVYVWKRTA